MPPRRPAKPNYTQYLVEINESIHSETIYLDDDVYTRQSHARAAPPIIPTVPPPMIPNEPPKRRQENTASNSTSRDHENSELQFDENLIESFEEPAPEDEIDWIENVRQPISEAP